MTIVAFIIIWFVGMVILLPFSYPDDPSPVILWWPIWLVTVFPIILVKLLWRFGKHVAGQMADTYKNF
jgi:hypothetical protein